MSSEYWTIGWAFSTITAVTFLGVAALLGRALWQGQQWRANPLAVATMLIFLTCGLGHALHSMQLLYPLFTSHPIGPASRIHYGEWHLWVADAGTAAAGTWYLMSRRAYPSLVSGAAMYENARRQQRRAIEIHDNIVQSLVKAKWNLDLEDPETAMADLDHTLARSKDVHEHIQGAH